MCIYVAQKISILPSDSKSAWAGEAEHFIEGSESRTVFEYCKTLELRGDDGMTNKQYALICLIGIEWNPGPTKRRSKASRGKNQTPKPVVCYTPQEAFEKNLAKSGDSSVIDGKVVGSFTLTGGTIGTVLFLQPANFGSRAAAYAGIFSNWRIKMMRVRFLGAATASVISTTSMGILDDVGVTGEPPTSVSGVAELRCSATSFSGESVPVNFEYTQVDKTQWFRTVAGTDQRWVTPGILYAASPVSGSVAYEIDFRLVFQGAYTTGSL
jgi:hypothetical protein